jgi:hypothetical protein
MKREQVVHACVTAFERQSLSQYPTRFLHQPHNVLPIGLQAKKQCNQTNIQTSTEHLHNSSSVKQFINSSLFAEKADHMKQKNKTRKVQSIEPIYITCSSCLSSHRANSVNEEQTE